MTQKGEAVFQFSWFVAFGGLMAAMIAVASPATGILVFMSYAIGGMACWMLLVQNRGGAARAGAQEGPAEAPSSNPAG